VRYVLPPYGMVDGKPTGPSRPQAQFHQACTLHTYVMFLGGLGSGKSWAGAQEFITAILENREAIQKAGQSAAELTYLVGAPTYQLIDAGPWKHVLQILADMELLNGFSLVKGKPRKSHPREITLITGDVIKFVATDPQKYAGATVAGWWFDEAEEAQAPEAGFALLDNRLRDSRARRKFGIVTSTPTVAGQGVAQMFLDRVKSGDIRYHLVRARTDTNPANADGDYVSRRSATMSEREKRVRLEGEVLPPENTVYGLEVDSVHSVAVDWTWRGPRQDREYYIAVDWGGHYVGLLIEHDPVTGLDVVFDEVICDRVQDDEFLVEVERRLQKWGIQKARVTGFYCDANPAQSVRLAYSPQWFRGKVRSQVVRGREDKQDGIDVVRWRLRPSAGPRMLLVARHLVTGGHKRGIWNSLNGYVRRETVADGQRVVTQEVNQDSQYSHACDALRYYAWQRYTHLRWRA
jgi:hypothetical protein